MMSSSLKKAFWLIGLTFAVLFIAIYVTVRLSVENARPVIDPDYQEKGLLYASYSEQYKRASESGWNLQWRGEPLDPDRHIVMMDFHVTADGRDVRDLTYDIVMYREGARDNSKIRLSDGQKETVKFFPGKWNIRAEAYDGKSGRIFREWNLTFR